MLMNTTLIVVVVILVIAYFWYASIIGRRNKVLEALGGIDVQLTQRHDLIPNVLEIAKAFMGHERGLLDDITRLRAQAQGGIGARDAAGVQKHLEAETALSASLGRFFALAENYPQLKSDAPMLEAQRTYRNVEDNIAAARRFYNSSVTALNNAVQIFPGSIFAGLAGVTAYPFYAADAAQKEPVSAAGFFKQ